MEWLIVFIIALVLEAVTACLVSIWFCAGALVAMFADLFGVSFPIQIAVFLVTSLLLLIFTKPFVNKLLRNTKHKTNIDALINKQAIVTVRIDNLNGTGQVKVEGKDWSARCVDDTVIEAGEIVAVVKIEGVKLVVNKILK